MRRFVFRHWPAVRLRAACLAGLGAACALILLGAVGNMAHVMLVMAPFGASCVLLFCAPQSPLSQPINVVGGHVLAGSVGLAAQALWPEAFWMAGMAVGLAISAMMLLRLVHPPAGATAFVAYTAAAGWLFLFTPILLGSVGLVLLACVWHRLNGVAYPLALPHMGQPKS